MKWLCGIDGEDVVVGQQITIRPEKGEPFDAVVTDLLPREDGSFELRLELPRSFDSPLYRVPAVAISD